ncbi:hypothetical protein F5146DRAFT_66897 [Armillaria mellea]|nr:hypothetical protein F5146DRAFT_66897 [Armillaria mellea]
MSRLGSSPGQYLYLFLGPLPHILGCLETVRIDTLSQRKKTQDKCSHNEYDALDDQLIHITKAHKAAVRLQQQLGPSSVLHERWDSKELRKLVGEATGLVSSLLFKTSLNLSDDLHIAHKGIVAERSVGTLAGKKPVRR